MDQERIKDKFVGCLLGLAIGDALGMPAEGKDPETIKLAHGYITDFKATHDVEAGTYTDDIELSLIVAEHLIEQGGIVHRILAADFVNKWAYKIFSSSKPKFYGASCLAACRNIFEMLKDISRIYNEQIKLERSNGDFLFGCGVNSAGNGGAMRVAPLGLFFNLKEDEFALRDAVVRTTKLTHNNLEACAGAVAIAYGVARLVHLETVGQEFLDGVFEFTKDLDLATAERIKRILEYSGDVYPHNSGRVLDSVPAAFFYFMSSLTNLESSLIRAVNAGGDADTIASMAGALSGAYNGLQIIPVRWVNGLKDSDRIRETALKLYDAQYYEE